MKRFTKQIWACAILLGIFSELLLAVDVKPTVRAVKGIATNGAGQQLKVGDTLSAGAKVDTGKEGGVLIEPLPGQALFVAQESHVQMGAAKLDSDGKNVVERKFTVNLLNGRVHSSVDSEKSSGSVHRVETKYGVLAAAGTSWGSWQGQQGLRAAVFAGRVTFNAAGLDAAIILEGGMVLLVSVDSSGNPVIDVINLRVGTVIHYAPGAAPVEGKAIFDQISLARTVMMEDFSAFLGTGTGEEKRLFGLLLEREINLTLASFNLGPILQLSDWTWPPLRGANGLSFRDTVIFPRAANTPPPSKPKGGGGKVVSPEAP